MEEQFVQLEDATKPQQRMEKEKLQEKKMKYTSLDFRVNTTGKCFTFTLNLNLFTLNIYLFAK